MGRAGLINSGCESKGASDLAEAVKTSVINQRADGMGSLLGVRWIRDVDLAKNYCDVVAKIQQ